MPIYEYRCDACRKVSSFLILKRSDEDEVLCRHCGSKAVTRILSRVTVLRSEEKRIESLLDPGAMGDLDENDPRSMERLMKRMEGALGDELGEGFQEEMEEALASSDSASPEGDL